MLRESFPAWSAAFSERSDGDLRIGGRDPGTEPFESVALRVMERLGLGAVTVQRQVHGSEVVEVDRAVAGYVVDEAQADGAVTALTAVAVAVHAADCLPIALGGDGGVAVVHAGWRGLAAGVIGEGVRALRRLGVDGPLEAVIGPGAGGCCYETGDEVRERFAAYGASRGRLLDIKAVAAAQLREAGVHEIRDVALCTICAPEERFFSHRRDGARTGRQGGFAWLG